MSKSAAKFLQQENLRFKKDNETLGRDNQRLGLYLDTIKELYWSTQQITAEENLLYALNQLLYKVMSVIGAIDSSLSRLDEESGELVFVLSHGDLSQQLPGFRIKSDVGTAGWVVENREPIIVNHPQQDWRFSEVVDTEFHFFTKSIVSVPIIKRDKLMGVIQLLNKRGGAFNEADVTVLLVLGFAAAMVIEEFQSRIEDGQANKEDFYA